MVSASDSASGLFAGVEEYPDRDARRRYDSLVGLDDVKMRLTKNARSLLLPDQLKEWASRHHGSEDLPLVRAFGNRPPMFVFAGDVGTGKTALAESFGDAVARDADLPILLYRLSLTARGSGAVGEMTQLLSAAFAEVRRAATGFRGRAGRRTGGVILVIDEADALAQSRELAQMHHEDRAGVNELIRGIDDFARSDLPVLVVMCTNRLSALDPAVRRRAADTLIFTRPNDQQRLALLERLFAGTAVNPTQLARLTSATGSSCERDYGWTYSDLTDRLSQAVLLDAFPDGPVNADRAIRLATQMQPTPPFNAELA